MRENESEKDPMPFRTISGSASLEGGEEVMISSHSAVSCNPCRLSTRQKYTIPLVLAAKSIEEGCRTAGIAKRTGYNWMHDEGFKAAVGEGREALSSEALDRLKAALTSAVEGLTGLVEAEEKNIRLKACAEVIDYFLKARELEDLERRLAALERAILGEERQAS